MNKKFYSSSTVDHHVIDQLKIGTFCYRLIPAERFMSFNQSFVKFSGVQERSILLKKKLRHLFFDQKDFQKFMCLLKKQKNVTSFETCFKSKEHNPVFVGLSAYIQQEKTNEISIYGVVQDISLFKEKQELLAQEMSFLQSFLDQMPDAIYFKDKKSRITRVNQFYARGFKMNPDQVIGRTDFDFFPKSQAKKMFEDDQKVIKSGKPIVGMIEKTLLPNGTWNQVITTKVPIFDRQGKPVGLMGITRDMTEHANLEKERFGMLMNALTVLNKALELRDPYTFSHARNVGNIAEMIGKEMGFDEDRAMKIKLAADLHDLGKISVPLDILTKPGQLSPLEYKLVQEHVQKCHDLIEEMKFPFALAKMIYQHHERLDGTGYPNKLKSKDILLESKILAVSDVLESMTSHRPYRAAPGIRAAISELKIGAGKRYDKKIVDVVLYLIRKNKGNPFWLNY